MGEIGKRPPFSRGQCSLINTEHIILSRHLSIQRDHHNCSERNKKLDTKRRLLRCFVFVGLLFLICAYLFPQNKNAKKETSTKGRSRFEVKVNAVVINATVTDKAGNPVTDLTVRDFKLYEDGKPQNIQTFAVESIDPPELENAQAPSASPGASAQSQSPDAKTECRTTASVDLDNNR